MAKKVSSIKHKDDKRAHIPSQEEAGYEDANPKVKAGKKKLELDLNPKYFNGNPVIHRGQDPELFWMNKYGPGDTDDRLKWTSAVCTAMNTLRRKTSFPACTGWWKKRKMPTNWICSAPMNFLEMRWKKTNSTR